MGARSISCGVIIQSIYLDLPSASKIILFSFTINEVFSATSSSFSSQVYSLIQAQITSAHNGLRPNFIQTPQLRHLWHAHRLGNRHILRSPLAPLTAPDLVPTPPLHQHRIPIPPFPTHRIHQARASNPKSRAKTRLPSRPR